MRPAFKRDDFDWNALFHEIDQVRGFAILTGNPHYTSVTYPLHFCRAVLLIGLIAASCAVAMATGVAAAEFPALFRVTGVAADDVLNVRSEPDARAEIVFELPADRDDLEVLWISEDSKWARVGLGEISGWVSTRFLEPQAARDPRKLPVPMRCVGVEPFWGLHMPTAEFAEYEMLPEPEKAFEIVHQGVADGRGPSELSAWFTGEDSQGVLFLERAACSDGMSDRDYALRGRFILRSAQQTVFHTGCCYISGH